MRIIFPYLILHWKENFLLMDKSVNSTSLLYPIPPSSIVDSKYCVSSVLNIHIYFTAKLGNAEVVIEPITCYHPHYYHQIFLLKKHMVKHIFYFLTIYQFQCYSELCLRVLKANSQIRKILVNENISNILINWDEIAYFILTRIHHFPTNYIYSFIAVALFCIFSW